VKEHYHSTIKAVEAELADFPLLSLSKLPPVYPSGDELILIKDVTGRLVEPGKLPITVGVVVCNVESVYNIYRAMNGKPVTDKYVTIAGEVKRSVTVKAPIGTKIKELIVLAGGYTRDNTALISGGPMMGKLISETDVVTKTTNAIIALPADHSVILNKNRNPKISLKRAMSVCCQCRSCTELCSRHVLGYPVEPHMVMRVLSNGGKGDLKALEGSMFCSSCGLCETYSCPQDLSPRALIDEIKATAKKNGIPLPSGFKADENVKDAEFKRVSVERLTTRLGLKKYDVPAPIIHEGFAPKSVKLLLSQHLGAPAVPVVKEGDEVKRGDVIAKAIEGALGVNIHASIDGKVTAVTDKYVKIGK
jgi:Na+-translocating ferredoxin:NAD+ oxidoreductase RnfC subunit